jgi:cytochrome c peroxidase
MKKLYLIIPLMFWMLMVTNLVEAQQADLLKQAKEYFDLLPNIMASKQNPFTPEKAKLGKMLFYETRISVDKTVSCFKCHWINLYATDGLPKAIGNNYRINPRNSPTVFNAAGQISEHWIGNRESVEDQAKNSLLGKGSYGLTSFIEAEKNLKAIKGYHDLFQKAFPQDDHPVNVENFARAIGAWERTLVTPSRFDQFLKGKSNALYEGEKRALKLFMDTGCVRCHHSAFIGGQSYKKFGITQPYWELTGSKEIDEGRYVVTNDEADKYVFKVPMLRNVEMTSPYFHDGSVDQLSDVVKIMAQLQLGKMLTDDQAGEIVIFLKLVTGKIPEDALIVPVLPPVQ